MSIYRPCLEHSQTRPIEYFPGYLCGFYVLRLNIIMKNLFKFGFLALAISLSVAACSSNKTEDGTSDTIDSAAEATTDSLESKIDTVDSVASNKIDSVQH